jgi:hypothetical protein
MKTEIRRMKKNIAKMGYKVVGYHVYHCPDGCGESYCGFSSTIQGARKLASRDGLPEDLYDTAKAGGLCYGIDAPDKSCEFNNDDEPCEWCGKDGFHCIVAVLDRPMIKNNDEMTDEQFEDEQF